MRRCESATPSGTLVSSLSAASHLGRANVGSVTPKLLDLGPAELADVAEAALVLGLAGLAQVVLNAAYDRANGQPIKNLERVFAEIRMTCVDFELAKRLTARQRELLHITALE